MRPIDFDLTTPVLAEREVVFLGLLYNAFDPSTIEKYEMDLVAGQSLADYVGELPAEASWQIALNGIIVPDTELADFIPGAGDLISVIQIPLGSNGVKQILQIVAMIALAVASYYTGGLAGVLMMAVGSIVISLAFAPKAPATAAAQDLSSYGIDGEKNTSVEGIPVPVIYGEYRVAGNVVDLRTEHVGDDQYLYMRSVLSDGEIDSVSVIELNEQPIANFKDVETRIDTGRQDQDVNDWFVSAVRLVNVTQTFTDTTDLLHTTQGAVDRVRFDIAFPSGLAKIDKKTGNFSSASVSFVSECRLTGTSSWVEIPGDTASFRVTDSRTKVTRHSFQSDGMPFGRGIYDLRVRRTSVPSTDQYLVDSAVLTDIGEIDNDAVAMRGAATLSAKILMSDQLNAIPQITGVTRGAILQEYDIDGTPTVKRWSPNCAWIALDMMCGEERGVGFSTSRIDWPKFVEWANDCDTYGWYFNGVFKDPSNLADCMRVVMTIGHATPTRIGTKFSLAIDKPQTYSMVFGMGSIVQDSFSVSYASMTDRANEFEVTYFNKDDRNKSYALRIVDPNAIEHREVSNVAQIQLTGVDNHAQAEAELWRYMYANRLIQRTLNFDAPIEAIALAIGDLALVTHDSVRWANSGKLIAGSDASTLLLDQPVLMETGKSYGALVTFSAAQLSTVTVTTVMGRDVTVTSADDLTALPISRIRSTAGDADDFEIQKVTTLGGGVYKLRLGSSPMNYTPGRQLAVWCVDQTYERTVVYAAGQNSVIALTTPLPAVPGVYANWLFGEQATIKHPYRLTAVAEAGLDHRSLTMVEYNEGVYAPPGTFVDLPTTLESARIVGQVTNLAADYSSFISGDNTTIRLHLSWDAGVILNYAGADIYMAINGADFRAVASQALVTDFATTASIGDNIIFKVLAYNNHGDRSFDAGAPTYEVDISADFLTLDPPTNPVSSVVYGIASATLNLGATPPVDTDPTGYEFQYRLHGTTTWVSLTVQTACSAAAKDLQVGSYDAQVRSVRGAGTSTWVSLEAVIAAPSLRSVVVGLRLAGGAADVAYSNFTGRDAAFTWTKAPQSDQQDYAFRDYEVRILTMSNVLVRTEYVVDPAYTYTFEKNAIDTVGTAGVLARRHFKFEVRERSRFGDLSNPAAMEAENLVPAGLAVVVDKSFAFISLTISGSSDPDLTGARVWMSTTSPVQKITANQVFDGAIGQVVLKASSSTLYYIDVAGYDAFTDGLFGADTIFSVTTDANPANQTDFTPPDVPTALALSSQITTAASGEQSVKLIATFLASTATDTDHYELAVRETAGGNDVVFEVGQPTSGNAVRFEIANVDKGAVYQARVRGIDHLGNPSAYGAVASTTTAVDNTPPGPVTASSVVASFKNFFLRWTNPVDADLAFVEVWEAGSNLALSAVASSATNVASAFATSFVRSAATTGQTLFFWLRAVDTSGNKSAFVYVGTDTAVSVGTADYQNLSIVNAAIANLAVDDAKIANLSAAKLVAGSVMTGSVYIGGTPDTITTVALRASDPLARANSGSTQLLPGYVLIGGSTSLQSWIYGGDNTSINGGAIGANTIAANKLTIGLRGITVDGFDFVANAGGNVSWNSGTIRWTDDTGAPQTTVISGGSVNYGGPGTLNLIWNRAHNYVDYNDDPAFANSPDWLLLATYKGGTDLNVNLGRTIIDGDKITTGTISADRIKSNTVFAQNLFIGGGNLALYGSYGGAGKGAIVVSDGTVNLLVMGWITPTNLGFQLQNAAGELLLSSSTPASAIQNSALVPSITAAAQTAVLSGVSGAGALAGQNAADFATQVSGAKPAIDADKTNYVDARIANGRIALDASGHLVFYDASNNPVSLGSTSLTGLGAGALAFINAFNSGNIGTYMANGTIGRALIGDAAIGNAQIANLSVDAAKIALASIGTAQISEIDAGVLTARSISTDRLAVGGVTFNELAMGSQGASSGAYYFTSVSYNGAGTWRALNSTTFQPSFGRPVKINATMACRQTGGSNGSEMRFRITRSDGVQVYGTSVGMPVKTDNDGSTITLSCFDGSAAAGTNYTYTVELMMIYSDDTVTFGDRIILIEELARTTNQNFYIQPASAGTGLGGGGGGGGGGGSGHPLQ